jgi:hypothetical protein
VTADVFPTAAEIIRFMRRCTELGVTAKATAGLHHPLRGEYRLTYADDAVRGMMYGYLNVFLAAASIRAGASDAVADQILTATDAGSISMTNESVTVCGFAIADLVLAETRERGLVSFGSCSFREPVDELQRLQRNALDPAAIERLIGLIEHEQGYPLYAAVGQLKRALSDHESAVFRFDGGGLDIGVEVDRTEFEAWIAPDLARIEQALDHALQRAGIASEEIDRVFLTGGSSLIPAVRSLFDRRFGTERIASGGELTSIAHGLAMIGSLGEPQLWAA